MRFAGIFNRNGGTFRSLDMDDFCSRAKQIRRTGGSPECRLVAGEELLAAFTRRLPIPMSMSCLPVAAMGL